MATTDVQLSDRFPKGSRAYLSVLAGSVVEPGGSSKQMTVGNDGKVRFSGCEVGVQYQVKVDGQGWSGYFRVQAKDDSFSEDANLHRDGPEATGRRLQADREAQADARREAEKKDRLAFSPAPGRNVVDNRPTKGAGVPRPQPAPRQEDTRGPQRSDTPTGEATPVAQEQPKARSRAAKPKAKTTRTGTAKRAAKKRN